MARWLLSPLYMKSHTQPPTFKWIIQAQKGHYCSFSHLRDAILWTAMLKPHFFPSADPTCTVPSSLFAVVLVLKACQGRT